MQKALEQSATNRRWSMGGKEGEREKRGRGRAQTSTHKCKHGTTRHKNTREEEEYYKGGSGKILRSVKAAVRIFLKVEGRDQYIQ